MYRLLVSIVFAIIILPACTGQKKSGVSNKNVVSEVPGTTAIDSSTYNDDYTVTDLKKAIEGRWVITKMHRQPNSVAEDLSNVSLTFADSAFAGKAPCNSIAGDCYINGMKIKFINIISTKMACANLEQETAYLKLLENTISNFSIKDEILFLKDAAGKIIFEGAKE